MELLQEKRRYLIPRNVDLTCEDPNIPSSVDEFDLTASSTHMIDLIVHAMRCDLTCTGLIALCEEGSGHNFKSILGSGFGAHHGHTHGQKLNNPNDKDSICMQKIVEYYAGRINYLINRLKSTPDPSGSGTLFDNTIVVWTSTLSDGSGHKTDNMPMVYASGSSAIKTQKIFNYTGASHGRFLITLAKAMGININSFGISTGAFSDILA